jgi:alcohol dehydrogenase (NADP+)
LIYVRDAIPAFNAFALIGKEVKIGGSMTGSAGDIKEMLDVAVKHKVKTWTQTRKMAEANEAVVDMDDGKARYRYVLVNEKYGGKL